MNLLKTRIVILTLVSVSLFHPPAILAGLYEDEGKNTVNGDLNDQDYWWAKFDAMMLDLAMQQHQPEGRIGLNLASSVRRLDDLAKKFPKRDDIKKWIERAQTVQAKIDPNADRGKSLGPECPWEESNFAQLWVNLHWARSAFDAKDYTTAQSCLQNVMQNYEIMLRPDRMKDYPDELRKWVVDSKPDADKLYASVKEKTHS